MLLARRAMMGKKGGLPSAYQQVEWIECSGTQYIDTGVINTSSIWEIDAQSNVSTTSSAILLGHYEVGSNWFGCVSSGKWGLGTSSGAYFQIAATYRITANIEFSVSGSTATTTATIGEQSVSRSGAWASVVRYFKIGCVGSYPFNGKIFSAKASVGGENVRNFIPCYRKSDNVIGMYDLCGSICPLTGTPFYINAGKGTFTKGPNV